MRQAIAIEAGAEGTAFGVVVPDLPGCFSAGDTLDQAIVNAQEAIAAWVEAELDAGRSVPEAGDLGALQRQRASKGCVRAVVEVDPARLDETVERVKIRLRRRVLSKLDVAARAAGETRSGYIAPLPVTN